MALAWSDPHRFAGDLFVKFGSQDAYSIFSPIYGALIRIAGLTNATMGLQIAGFALWLLGCWRLARQFVPESRAAVVILIFAVFHISYGGFSALYLAEGLVTSRIFTEAFVLIGLAEMVKGSWLRAAPYLILSAALHPLMALGGPALAAVWESFRRPWILPLAALAGVGGVALAIAGLHPFDRLLTVMDSPWLAAVDHRNGFRISGQLDRARLGQCRRPGEYRRCGGPEIRGPSAPVLRLDLWSWRPVDWRHFMDQRRRPA